MSFRVNSRWEDFLTNEMEFGDGRDEKGEVDKSLYKYIGSSGKEASRVNPPEGEMKRKKTTAPRIPAWSPTVVLTGRHPG